MSTHAATSRQRGFGLVAVLTVFFVVIGLVIGLFTLSVSRGRSSAGQREGVTGIALTESALSRALYEINHGVDLDGGGLGGIGVTSPAPLGNGEYRSIAQPDGDRIRVVVVAALPDFEHPQALRAAEVLLGPRFPFRPRAAAFSADGDGRRARFEFRHDAVVRIDGGEDAPGLMFSGQPLMRVVTAAMAHEARRLQQLDNGVVLSARRRDGGSLTIVGDPATLRSVELPRLGEAKIPVDPEAQPTLDAETLGELQRAFVERAAARAGEPDAVVIRQRQIRGDHVYGSAEHPAVVVIDPPGHGGKVGLDGTLRGTGTLIVRARLRLQDRGGERAIPAIDWQGDVIVTGAGEHDRAELENKGGRVHVRGALVLAPSGARGEVRLRSEPHRGSDDSDRGDSGRGSGRDRGDSGRGSGHDRGDSGSDSGRGRGPAVGGDITVDGALLALAGADDRRHERAEIRLRDGTLTVNGVLATLGSRVELRVDGAGHDGGDSDRDSGRGSDRGSDRDSGRGSDRGSDRCSDRGDSGRGSDRGDSDRDSDDGDDDTEPGQPTLSVRGTFAVGMTDGRGHDRLSIRFRKNAVADLLWDEDRVREALEMLDELTEHLSLRRKRFGVDAYRGNYGGVIGLEEIERAIRDGATGLPAATSRP